jgi:predicted P-loop ATPase
MDTKAENPAGGNGGAYRNVSSEVECSESSRTNGQGQGLSRAAQLTEAAQKYHDNHHWVPLRLEDKSPECMGKGWQKRTLKDPIPRFKEGDNLGILLGMPSGDLVRLDPDFAAIPDVTDILWPEPTLIYGRASSPRSGRLIICKVKSKDFNLPASMKDDPRLPLHDGKRSVGVFQILSTGKQTSVPPSKNQHNPVALDAAEVMRRAGIEAFLMAVAHFWPARGTRNEAAIALARPLLEALADCYPDDEERVAVVDDLVLEVAMAGGDGEESRDGKERARKKLEKMRAGEDTTGMPRLVELLGLPADVAETFRKWLGIKKNEHGFELGLEGFPKARSQKNIRRAMELLGVQVRYDKFHDRMLIAGVAGHDLLDDDAVEKLWLTIDEKYKFLPIKDFFFTVVKEAARRNSFHPVQDYLNSLQWDGWPRIDEWLSTYGGAKKTHYVCAVSKLILVAAVRRIRKPGSKFDEMPIFESMQGKDKSSALKILAVEEDWFGDDLPLTADSKKLIEQTRGRWIVEVADLSGMRKADIEHLKASLSRAVDRSRLSYGRMTTEKRREFVVVGTTNEECYLRDLTGNRRFWPVKTPAFDLASLKRDRDQLWAEAAVCEAEGFSIRLDPGLWDAAAVEQQERTVEDPWVDLIKGLLGNRKGKMSAISAWELVGVAAGQRTQAHNARLGPAMKAAGWKRRSISLDGKKQWGYVRGRSTAKAKLKYIIVTRSQFGADPVVTVRDDDEKGNPS